MISSHAIWGSGANDIWQVGDNGGIARSDGTKWSVVSRGLTEGGKAIMGSGPDDVWNINSDRGVMHYDGKQWSSKPRVPTYDRWMNLWVASKTSAWMLGYSGTVAHWDGTEWSALPDTVIPGSIWASAENEVWVASDQTISRWDGSKWNKVTIYDDCGNFAGSGLWGASPTDLWVVRSQRVMHVTGGNVSTNPAVYDERHCTPDTTVTGANSVWGRAADDVWAYGDAGAIYHYDGKTWKKTPTPVQRKITSLWASSRDDAWATAWDFSTDTSDDVLLHWDGKTWSKVEGVAGFTAVWGADAKNVWTVADGGRVLRFKP